jgi:hypothetical protein
VIALRTEEPARSTPTLIDIVERAGEVAKGGLRRSTLDRHLDRRGASRRMMHVLGAKRRVRLSFAHPLDFVLGDFHAGPYVRDAAGEIRRTEGSPPRLIPVSQRARVCPECRHVRPEPDANGADITKKLTWVRIFRELTQTLRNSVTIDWTVKEVLAVARFA